jgi:23S rRNA (cytosine1962-C5)-methyltransferase
MKRIILRSGEEDRILRGHPWVYDNEVDCVLSGKGAGGKAAGNSGNSNTFTELLEPGECADVESARKQYLGRAIVNPHSKIIARIYSPSKEGLDKGFFKRRIREALQRRAAFRDLSRESARIVFAEADFLPGLIIDRFVGWPLAELEAAVTQRPLTFELAQAALGPPQSWLSIQFLAWGMDCRREMILEAADEALCAIVESPTGIIEKTAPRIRELEGLPLREELIRGTIPLDGIVIFENGFPFAADLPGGQKTGHFLDQRDNRLLAGKCAALLGEEQRRQGKAADDESAAGPLRVLDMCSYTGGFGIHVLRAAENAEVTAVDVSAPALETVRKNAALNGVGEKLTTIEGDIFETLRTFERKKEKVDLIILDPPAFAKSRTAVGEALRGYKEINLQAIKLLRQGGILITCSCSQALDEGRFKRMIAEAAADAERRLVQIDFRYQGPDHPVLIGYDESLYLKCGVYRVL